MRARTDMRMYFSLVYIKTVNFHYTITRAGRAGADREAAGKLETPMRAP